MYKLIRFILIVFMLIPLMLRAQDLPLQIRGQFITDQRFRLRDEKPWSWNENRLDLMLEKKIQGKARFYSDIWLRNFGFPDITSAHQLIDKNITSPLSIELREAYVELYGLLSDHLDIRIGRQRIAWGTADRLNPTDNLNAYDLEDIWDFGRHHGSDAIRMTYYLNNFRLEGIFLPFFRPATLPYGDWASAMFSPPELPENMYMQYYTDSLLMPANNLAMNPFYAIKFGGSLFAYDFSLSYLYGRDGLPVSVYNELIPVDTLGGVQINTELIYFRQHIFGADMAGAIGSVGIWAEAALYLPEQEIHMQTDITALIFPPSPFPVIQDTVVLKKELYMKYVIGMDYTFRDGSYINFQYLHGFIHERGRGGLDDYFMLGIEKRLFNDQLKIIPLAGGFIVSDWKALKENYAFIYTPGISYFPNDNTEIGIGIRLISGKGNNSFARLNDYDEFFFSLKYNF